jgi:hypothetical protein
VFVKNFYQPHFAPRASEAHLLRIGKLATLTIGAVVVLVALEMSRMKGIGLFLLMQRVSILIATPVIMPLLLGLIVRQTPPWSAWSTVLVGFCGSLVIGRWTSPEWAAHLLGHSAPLSLATAEYWTQASEFFGNVILSSIWFFGTKLFWRGVSVTSRKTIGEFFVRLNTPVDFAREEGAAAANDDRQSKTIGWLCVVYGSFVTLLVIIPNSVQGRLAFVGCGVFVLFIGAVLIRTARVQAPHGS